MTRAAGGPLAWSTRRARDIGFLGSNTYHPPMGRRLGQHFLTHPAIARSLVDAAGIHRGDTVLEIGPGRGALTRELLSRGARVIAIEKDHSLISQLHHTFKHELASEALTLIEKDVRDFNPRDARLAAQGYALAANIPYYITGEIIRRFLTATTQPKTMALLVQKEVAARVIGKARGTRHKAKESLLSLSVKAYGTPRFVKEVSRGNFSPSPSVDSAILLIADISRAFFRDLDEKKFFAIVRAGFASKRKKLHSNLARIIPRDAVARACASCELSEDTRAEDVPLEGWRCLAREIGKRH